MNYERIKVLLIDDDDNEYLSIRKLFSGSEAGGYRVDRISNYADALAAITADRHHICLVGCRLGERSGAELVRKGREAGSRLPVIMLVGRDSRDSDVGAADFGSTDYLVNGETSPVFLEGTIRQVINRRRVEDALHRSEAKFRMVLENSRDIIYQFNLQTRVFDYMSPAAKELSGYDAEEFIERGFSFSNSLVHPADLESMQNYVRRVMRPESAVDADRTVEYRLKTKANGYRWISENRAVVRDEHNIPIAIIAIARDVTEQKQAASTLHLQKTLLEAQSEASPDGILVVGTDGAIIFHNRRFVEIWEIPEPVLAIGTNDAAMQSVVDKLVYPENFLETAAYLEQHPNAENQEEILLKDGRIIDLYTTPITDADENYYGRICYFRDITERRRAAAALEQSEKDYRTVFERAHDAIVILAPEDEIVLDVNDRACEVYGFSRAEFVGMSMRALSKNPVRGDNRVRETLEAGEYLNFETVQFRKDGSEMFLEINASTILYQGRQAIISINRDITERHRAEELVRQSEAKYRTILESIEEGYYEIDLAGNYTFFNNALCQSLGYNKEEMLGINYRQYVDAEIAKKLFALFNNIYTTGEPLSQAVYEVIRKDGARRIHETSGSLIRDPSGEPTGFRGLIRDITDRKRSEDRLRQSEANLAAAQRITHLGSWEIVLTDFRRINNNRVYWSDEVYRLFGYEPGQIEVSINHYFNSVHPRERTRVRKAFFEAVSYRKELNIEFSIVLPDNGGERILHGLAEVLYDAQSGKPRKFIGTVQDITDRKRAEVALSEANERAICEYERLLDRLAQLAESLGSARDLQMIYQALHAFARASVPCNGFFISLYDQKRDVRVAAFGADGGAEFDVSELPPMPMSDSPNSRAVSTRKMIVENDFQKAMGNRPVVHIGLDKNPELPQSCLIAPMSVMGRIVGAVEVQSTNLAAYSEEHSTALRMAANLAANAIENVRLLAQEREKDEQLRQSQKLESVGRLAGGIAHDFNNMLTAINGYSDLVLRKLAKDDPMRRSILEIKKAGERSSALTHQLLAFSRQQILQLRVLDLNDVIEDTAKMLERLIGEDIHLLTDFDPELSGINADPGQLTQVIMNLAVNARDAMPEGGILTIETRNVYLDEEFTARHAPTKPGAYVLLSIRDTGIGMDAETRQHVFEPFFTTKEVGKGTGLGLATVYGIVKQSGGYIWIDTGVGVGSTFRVYLPVVAGRAEAVDRVEESLIELQKGAETVLLVEDEEIVRKLNRQILEICGYKVIEASNGVEALEIGGQNVDSIDLLLTDVVMPQMGGRELAEKMIELRPRLRVLFTSGYTNDLTVRHGINQADINFIQKPFTFDALADKVREVLDAPPLG